MAKSGNGNVVTAVRNAIAKTVEELGYEILDVEYVKEGSEMYLRITIDSPDGIDIDDCETVHRAIDPILDEVDPIEESYHLEVSSPGIERELKTEAHFEAFVGAEVEVRLYAPVDGAKVFQGELLGLGDRGEVRISVGGQEKTFAAAAVATVRTVYRFENDNENA